MFGTAPAMGFQLAASEAVLQKSVMSYWGAFAWSGSPNNLGQSGLCRMQVRIMPVTSVNRLADARRRPQFRPRHGCKAMRACQSSTEQYIRCRHAPW